MKTHRFVLAFCVLMLLPAFAHADFYVIPGGGAPAGTQIKSLPYTISAPGLYYIKQDLASAAGSDGITITANDVTLDLMGFSLIGPGSGSSSGIYMNGRSNVEIRNGSVRGFGSAGVYAYGGDTGHRVINVRAHGNGYSGITLNGKAHLVKDCTSFSNVGSGMYVEKSSIVLNCTTFNNTYNGIEIGVGSSAIGNTSYGNTHIGIYGYYGTSIVSNNCYDNVGDGIYAYNYSLVKGNVCYSNSNYGIHTAVYCLIMQNVCNSNTSGNIHNATGCSLVDNVAP